MEVERHVSVQKPLRQRQEPVKQSNRVSMGTRIVTDHDSSFHTIGTLDDSCVSQADQYRAGFQLNSQNQESHPQQNVLDQVYSSSLEREQEIIRLQKKMCKFQHRIGKLQKRVEQLQRL